MQAGQSTPTADRPSLLGKTMVSARSKSGRRWEVYAYSATADEYRLHPIGAARSGGGVRAIRVPFERLHDDRFWREW